MTDEEFADVVARCKTEQDVEDLLAVKILTILSQPIDPAMGPEEADAAFWRWVDQHATPALLKVIDEFVDAGLLERRSET